MRVVIIGAGNVATILGRLLKKNGHDILQIISKHNDSALILATELNCAFTINNNEIDRTADIYLIAVADNSLKELGETYRLDNKLVVHTAGAISKEILKNISINYGVLYPLQSLLKQQATLQENIPLLLDANTSDSLALLKQLATSISSNCCFSSDEQRLKLHVAAVLVSNFTNHLYTMAAEYCTGEKVDFKMLLPLIEETATRLHKHKPVEMMTGPAFRGDTKTIEMHLSLLESYPLIQNIYINITESIMASKNIISM